MFSQRDPRSLARSVFPILLCSSVALLIPSGAEAQDSRWGVTGSFVPVWKPVPELYELLYDVQDIEAEGMEFRIGVVRGRDLGGDWSVTFVRNKLDEGTVFDDTFLTDFGSGGGMVRVGSFFVPMDVEVLGVKYEKFTPFVTIQDRVQIGLTYGGGIGSLRGTVEEHNLSPISALTQTRDRLWNR